MSTNLKQTITKILDALSLVGGPAVKALVSVAKWAVNWFVPDEAVFEAPGLEDSTMNAAPDAARNIVTQIFDAVKGYVGSSFIRSVLDAIKNLVLDYALDYVWDNVFSSGTPIMQANPVILISDDTVAEFNPTTTDAETK